MSQYEEGKPFTIVPEVRGNNVYPDKVVQAVREAVATGAAEVDLEEKGSLLGLDKYCCRFT